MPAKTKVRDRILNVASELFYRQGYNSTGINQIIAEADIAIGSLYNHFPSKTALLMAYLQKQETDWLESLEEYSRNTKSGKDRLLRFLDHRIAQQHSGDFLGCPFIKVSAEVGVADPGVLAFVEAHKEKQRTIIYELVRQVDYDGPLDRKLLAESIFLMTEGATVNASFTRNVNALEQVKKYLKKILE